MTIARRLTSTLLLLEALGCDEPAAPRDPVVRFLLDSETCGGPLTLRFSIDNIVVGTESLRDGESSPVYFTSPGQHVMRATIPGAVYAQDTTATLRVGETFTAVLNPYSS